MMQVLPEGLIGKQGQGAVELAPREDVRPHAPRTADLLTQPDEAGVMPFDKGGWVDKLCSSLAGGGSFELTVKLMGANYRQVKNWLEKGRNEDELSTPAEYVQFAREVDKARAYWEQQRLLTIQKAGDNGDWRASGFLLEKLVPESYGKQEQAGSTTAIQINLSFPTGVDGAGSLDDDALDV